MCIPGRLQRHQQWRLNSTLLSDGTFVKFIQEEIKIFLSVNMTPEISNLIVWDALKAYVRGLIIVYTARLKKENHKERSILQKMFISVISIVIFSFPGIFKTGLPPSLIYRG